MQRLWIERVRERIIDARRQSVTRNHVRSPAKSALVEQRGSIHRRETAADDQRVTVSNRVFPSCIEGRVEAPRIRDEAGMADRRGGER